MAWTWGCWGLGQGLAQGFDCRSVVAARVGQQSLTGGQADPLPGLALRRRGSIARVAPHVRQQGHRLPKFANLLNREWHLCFVRDGKHMQKRVRGTALAKA